MQIASLVLGIVGLLLVWVPVFGQVPAIIGLILGILGIKDAKAQEESAGLGVVGVVLSAVAIVVGLIITVVLFVVVNKAGDLAEQLQPSPAYQTVADGDLLFTTRMFICYPGGTDNPDAQSCILEYEVQASPTIREPVSLYQLDLLLVTAEAYPYLVYPFSFDDHLSHKIRASGGWCSSYALEASESTVCQSRFRVLPEYGFAVYVDYKAGPLTFGNRVWLPSFGNPADLSPTPEFEPIYPASGAPEPQT